MKAGRYIYRGPRDRFLLPGKRLRRDGAPVELDRYEVMICEKYINRGHRFECVAVNETSEHDEPVSAEPVTPAPVMPEPEPVAEEADAHDSDLASMTVAELRAYADVSGIDLAGARTKAAIIERIKAGVNPA